MTSLNDEQLLQYGERSKGKVVLVTGTCQNADVLTSLTMRCTIGAASGIGKETALVFAHFK